MTRAPFFASKSLSCSMIGRSSSASSSIFPEPENACAFSRTRRSSRSLAMTPFCTSASTVAFTSAISISPSPSASKSEKTARMTDSG